MVGIEAQYAGRCDWRWVGGAVAGGRHVCTTLNQSLQQSVFGVPVRHGLRAEQTGEKNARQAAGGREASGKGMGPDSRGECRHRVPHQV